VVDWERATAESEAEWARLLERLRQRGVTAERGLRLVVSDGSSGLEAGLRLVDMGRTVVHQRCIFHKLKNVREAVRVAQTLSQEDRRAVRKEVVQDAAAVYEGDSREAIMQRCAAFVAKWQPTQPTAVETLLRDFDKTLVYLDVAAAAAARGHPWDRKYLRTTSALERVNRTLRTMVRAVVLLHSDIGTDARTHLTLMRCGKFRFDRDVPWTVELEKKLVAA